MSRDDDLVIAVRAARIAIDELSAVLDRFECGASADRTASTQSSSRFPTCAECYYCGRAVVADCPCLADGKMRQ